LGYFEYICALLVFTYFVAPQRL